MNKKDYTLIEKNIWQNNSEPDKFVIDLYLGRDANGKQQRTTKTFYSLPEAQKALILFKAEKIKGTCKTKSMSPVIQKLMEDYRLIYIQRKTEETTAYGYSVIEKHISTFFEQTGKNARLDKITTTTIDQYFTYLSTEKGMGSNSVIKHYNYLSQIFDYAIDHSDEYGIQINPVKKAIRPKKQKANTPDLSAYNPDKINELINAVLATGDLPFETAVLIALLTGARRGEVEFLKWKSIDLDEGIVEIAGSRTSANKEIIRNTTKNGQTRETSLCDILINVLREYKEWQQHNKELMGKKYKDNDNVLVRSDGKPYSVKWINGRLTKFLKDNNFPHLRFHDLRHLNASVLLRILPVADVAKHLGHTTTNTTTRIYAHSLMKSRNAVAIGLNGVFQTQKKDKQEPVL